jgi:hypothetical protein
VALAAAARRKSAKSTDAPAPAAAAVPLSGDLAVVRQAIDLARKGKTGEATAIGKTIGDPAAQRLVEWFILRHPDGEASFNRFAAFIADNPHWPSMSLFRRRAEGRLWQERSDAATVRRFIADQPTSAKGRFALARVLLAEGDRDGAARLVREAWRSDELSERARPRRWIHSATFSPARTIGHAWTSASGQGFFGSVARRASPRRRRPLDCEGLCRGYGERDQGARPARRGCDRGQAGLGLHAMPY